MKWRSKDNKQELDFDKIGYWAYTSKEDAGVTQRARKNSEGNFDLVKEETSRLEVYMGGDGPLLFTGEEADEIYNKLISQKEIL